MISKSMSFRGYKFTEWLKRNKKTLKDLLTGVLMLSTYFATANNPEWLQIILTIVIPALVRIGVDALDYYVTEVKN